MGRAPCLAAPLSVRADVNRQCRAPHWLSGWGAQVNCEAEQDDFGSTTTACLGVLVLGIETRLDDALRSMSKTAWDRTESVGDQSDYVNTITGVLTDAVATPPLSSACSGIAGGLPDFFILHLPALASSQSCLRSFRAGLAYSDLAAGPRLSLCAAAGVAPQGHSLSPRLSDNHYQFFCEKLAASFIGRFNDAILRCRRVGEMAAQQMLLDTQVGAAAPPLLRPQRTPEVPPAFINSKRLVSNPRLMRGPRLRQAVRAVLLDLPVLEQSAAPPASYTKFVSAEMGRAERLLKVSAPTTPRSRLPALDALAALLRGICPLRPASAVGARLSGLAARRLRARGQRRCCTPSRRSCRRAPPRSLAPFWTSRCGVGRAPLPRVIFLWVLVMCSETIFRTPHAALSDDGDGRAGGWGSQSFL